MSKPKTQSISKGIRNLFTPKKKRKKKKINKKKEIKGRIIRDISTIFKQEDDCFKPERVSNVWNNNYIAYESKGDRNK